MTSIDVTRTLPVEVWKDFVDNHPDGNIFHTPEMFSVFARTKGYVPELWAAVSKNQVVALFLPVHVSLHAGLFRRFTTRSIVYGSILSQPGADGEAALRLLLRDYKKASGTRSLFTELRNISPLGVLLPLLQAEGFVYEEHLNYLINLDRPAEAVFESIGRRTRKNIKHAFNKGCIEIQEVKNRIDIASCYKLLSMTYRAAHVPLADVSLFEAAFDILSPVGMIRYTTAKVDEALAAVSVELMYKDVLYGWFGGMDRAFGSFVPNELLMWHILKWGAESGFKKYDFGGAGKPDEKYGVRDFKSKFGGELVNYGRNVWVPNPALMSLSKRAYETVRSIAF